MSKLDLSKFDPADPASWPVEQIQAEDLILRNGDLFELRLGKIQSVGHYEERETWVTIITDRGLPVILTIPDTLRQTFVALLLLGDGSKVEWGHTVGDDVPAWLFGDGTENLKS